MVKRRGIVLGWSVRALTVAYIAIGCLTPAAANANELPPPVITPPPSKPISLDLWLGARGGVFSFGDSFYINQYQQPESTGNFLSPGPFGGVDVGLRIAQQYIPYVTFEVAGAQAGHRFDGEGAHALSLFGGVGFRYIARVFHDVGFAADVSFGLRTVTISSSRGSYTMESWEIFRLGLGTEIRVAPHWSVSPMVTLSGGVMGRTSGQILFAPGQGDGLTGPTFENGQSVAPANIANYLDVSVGCGVHFDLPLRR